ncbi:DUF4430 domain-containing protein [Patescibacteria group bacterium]
MNKKNLIIALALITLAGAFFVTKTNTNSVVPQPEQKIVSGVTLKIDFGDDNITTFENLEAEGATAFSILEAITSQNNIAFETQKYDFGIFVMSINGKEGDAQMAWIYFVNGKPGEVAADAMALNPGDIVEWKYIKPE